MTCVLCLDDEPEILDLLNLILKPKGYEVFYTTSGYEALEILRHQPIDLVTQDFMRPELNGLEFLKIMKADAGLRDIPVIGVSARPRAIRTEEMKLAGLDIELDLACYVTKPFGPYELMNAVETVLTDHGKAIPPRPAQLHHKQSGEG